METLKMSQFKPNPQQVQAVNSIGKNIIVSASAGAGKTATLISRLMKRILTDGLSVNEICALTFTNAAAGDMKNKLLEALNKSFQSEETSSEDKAILSKEITLVETADITTIHSFCLTIIKNYGYIINIDPARTDNILDPSNIEIYKQEALQKTLNDYAKTYPHKMDWLLDSFISKPAQLESLEKSITNTAHYLNTKPHMESAIAKVKQSYAVQKFEDFPLEIQDAFFASYKLKITIALEALEHYLEENAGAYIIGGKEDRLQNFENLKLVLLELKFQVESHNLDFYDKLIAKLENEPTSKGLMNAPKADKSQKDLLATVIKSLDDLVKYYQPWDEMFSIIQNQAPIIDEILHLSVQYLHNYDLIKETAGGFDFDDFEKFALKILEANDGYIAKLLQDRYKEVMVDEFQDTNDYQDAIINAISSGNNTFRVGDVKQSIYQFRDAKPQIMQSYLNDSTHEKIIFGYNYRSSYNIVNFNNDLYKELMSLTQNFNYSEDDEVEAGNAKALIHNPKVKIKVINTEELNEESQLYQSDLQALRAKLVANYIIEMKEKGDFDYRDMTILVRTHSVKSHLKNAFEKANIPHFINEQSGFFSSEIINQVLAWIHFTVNPNDFYLVPLLKSSFIGYSYNQIAQLKIHSDNLSQSLKELDPQTYDLVYTTTQNFKHKDIVTVLTTLYNLNDTYDLRLSHQAKTNLDLLLDRAIQHQNTNSPSLISFLQVINKIDDSKKSEAVPIDTSENVVRVLTWHESKGLQYPLTIIWPTSEINKADFKGRILTDDKFGITLKNKTGEMYREQRSIYRILAEEKQTQDAVEEYLRMLYVATTRAQNELVLIDALNKMPRNTVNQYTLYNFRSSTELILPIMANKVRKDLREIEILKPEDLVTMQLDQKIETKDTESFVYKFPPLQSKTSSDSKPSLPFNRNFIESVGYGNTLHQLVEKLPHRNYSESDLDGIKPHFVKKLKKYNMHPLTQKLYQANTIENEMPVLYKENEVSVQGIIDFYAVFDDELIIVDYKTDAVDKETLIQRYTHQLQAYKKALDNIYPKLSIETYIYSFYLDDYIQIKVDAIE